MSKMLKPKLINEAAYAIEVLHEQCIRLATREIFLHSYICNDTEEPGVDYRMTATFIKNLQLLDHENDDILIHMSTVGGSYPDGMAIYDAIKHAQSHITILAYTAARSMSSIMLQAADCRVLMPHAAMMLHEGTMAADCSARLFQTEAAYDRLAIREMMNIYAGRCHGSKFFKSASRREIKSYIKNKFDLKQDWWIPSHEAVKLGLADAVIGDKGYESVHELRP
jgi:ATP-dependent protease ClpP protease subunit